MTHVLTFIDDVVAGVRAAFPTDTVPTVESYDGPADDDFITKYSRRAPAIVLTVLNARTTPRGGACHDRLQFGAYVFTKGRVGRQRTRAALAICEKLKTLLLQGTWTTDERYQAPSVVEAVNRFDGTWEDMGLNLWLLGWETVVELPGMTDDEYAALDDFRTLFSQIYAPDADPETDDPLAEQAIELEGVAP